MGWGHGLRGVAIGVGCDECSHCSSTSALRRAASAARPLAACQETSASLTRSSTTRLDGSQPVQPVAATTVPSTRTAAWP